MKSEIWWRSLHNLVLLSVKCFKERILDVTFRLAWNMVSRISFFYVFFLSFQVISKHQSDVISLQYSRDDRYLVSLSDYREFLLVIWSAKDYSVFTSLTLDQPMHSVQWNPYTSNKLVTIGRNQSVLFLDLIDSSEEIHKIEVKLIWVQSYPHLAL